MDQARRRAEEHLAQIRADAYLLKYLATEVVGQAKAKDAHLDPDVTEHALLAGYRQLLAHAHNYEHVLDLYDRKLDES